MHRDKSKITQSFQNKYTQNKEPTNKKIDDKSEFRQKRTAPQPMDIDPSIRSRLTLNKKHINNNEVTDDVSS